MSKSKSLKSSASGKSVFQVQLGLVKARMQLVPKKKGIVMNELIVRSNYARNKVVALPGNQGFLSFDARGEARAPLYLLEAVEVLMASKPGRFVLETAPVVEFAEVHEELDALIAQAELQTEVEVEQQEEEVEIELEPAPGLDQSFLTSELEEPAPPKRGRKKKQS
ncbi:hypothetical protein HC928_00345 [bacterium]|nr:hypothetical protein [bacterium]